MAGDQRLRVGFHTFTTYARHPGKDGANFAYTELGRLLSGCADIRPVPHDLVALARDDAAARAALAPCDVVVATVGPHAYLYLYLRERLGLSFRLIRDARTALWNGYLQQEALCAPYLRPGDVLVHSSRYSLGLYRALFPHLTPESQAICYPLLHWFPEEAEGSWTGSGSRSVTRIGFVGRLTDDKNYAQAVELLAELRRRRPGRFELHVVGEYQGRRGVPEGHGTPGYRWLPPIDRSRLWDLYREFDVLFFPSTSTLETFGRVLVEASYVGTPILASEHAATSELLPAEALVPTRYRTGVEFTTHFAGRLGDLDIEQAADRLAAGDIPPRGLGYQNYAGHHKRLLDLVLNGTDGSAPEPTAPQRDFLARVRMTGLDPLGPARADAAIATIRRHFTALHRRGRPGYALTLLTLLARSRYRRKTADFVRRSLLRGEDFTNIGGVDLQLSHLIGFEPRFRLA